jgi:hypothetical protein
MPDDFTTLNTGTGGDAIDEEAVTYGSAPTTRKRQRVVIGGSTQAQLVAVTNAVPSTEYGLVVRNIPSGNQQVIGAVAAGASVASTNPVLTAGYDGTNSRIIRTDSLGYQQGEIYDLDMLQNTQVSPQGGLRIAQTQRLVSDTFEGTSIDPTVWLTTVVSTATAAVSNGIMTLSTLTTATGSATVESRVAAEFVSGANLLFATNVRLGDTGVTGNVRRWGAFDAQNGFFFQLSGTTFSVVSRKASVDTVVNSGSFSGTNGLTTYTVDTNNHVYEILYSSNTVRFFIDRVRVHTLNAATTMLAATLTLKISHSNTNTSATTNQILEVRSTAISLMGGLLTGAGTTGQGGLITGPRKVATYQAVGRLAARPYALSKAMTANTRTQFLTMFHAATATKTVKIKEVRVFVEANSVAALLVWDLVRLTSATVPATGAPAITPASSDSGDAAAETTVLALPGTAGTEAAGSVFATREFNLGIVGAAPTTNPPPAITEVVLFTSDGLTEEKAPRIRAGVAEGLAIVLDANAASTVKAFVTVIFTEE